MLETMPRLSHDGCYCQFEVPDFPGHQSVTELEVCADYHSAQEAEQAAINAQQEAEWREHVRWAQDAEAPMNARLAEWNNSAF